MQTFMPYDTFSQSLGCLDDKRLGKQRVEAWQILQILTGKNKTKAWVNHPAVLMWKGYTRGLTLYYNLSLQWWEHRGFKNVILKPIQLPSYQNDLGIPKWLGNKDFHLSHRSNLLRKKPDWYKQFNWKVADNLPYIWPVKKDG